MFVCLLLVSGLATAVGQNGKISLLFFFINAFSPFHFLLLLLLLLLLLKFQVRFSHSTLLQRHRK